MLPSLIYTNDMRKMSESEQALVTPDGLYTTAYKEAIMSGHPTSRGFLQPSFFDPYCIEQDWVYSDQWAAGFFDGEGCVAIERIKTPSGNPAFSLRIYIPQKDSIPLEKLKSVWGGCLDFLPARTTNSGYHGPVHRWRICSRRAEKFLKAILPYSLCKRSEIKAALTFWDEGVDRECLKQQISQMKRRK